MQSFRGRRRCCLYRRQRAGVLGFDRKNRIEFATEILQRDDRGELDYLFIREMLLEAFKKFVRYPFPRVRHPLGQFQSEALTGGENRVLFIIFQDPFYLLDRRTFLHPTGCVDVDSIRTAVDARRFKAK